jgi:acyl-coenzyme A synthetase/AMP-(fatty) acid ligase
MTPNMLPLASGRMQGIMARRQGQAVTLAEYLADAAQLAAALPPGQHVLNACNDRYRFAVGLAAALLAGKISLLPPTLTAEMVRQVHAFAPDVFCLTDQKLGIALPVLDWGDLMASATRLAATEIPAFEASRTAVITFTSGSTGAPVAHRKSWGGMVQSTRAEAERLGLLDGRAHSIVATVPPQHMFGLESTVLLALQSGAAMSAAHPFYPADICEELAATPRPRMLVTTPAHLKVLLASGLAIPLPDLVLSATAPMPQQLAALSEERLDAPLIEIYGSTETGQIAWRRTTESAEWVLFPGVRLSAQDGRVLASGGHVDEPIIMADELELLDETHFLLNGRTADLVNIAGKRSSIGYLNHQLNAISGVTDGAFFMPDDSAHDSVTRLMAFVVAPGLEAAQVMSALRERIDAIFLPRPLVLLKNLPRNTTGKVTRETLEALAQQHLQKGAIHAG